MPTNQYYEGILQVRSSKELDKKLIDYIRKTVRKSKHFISQELNVKNGIDFYLSSQHFLQNLGKKLHNNLGGTLKVSKKIHTRNHLKSKDVYRVNVLFIPSEFKETDIIVVDEKIIKISRLGKQLKGTDIKTEKKISISSQNLKYELLPQFKTEITKIYPNIEVLHPETYQNIKINNKKDLKIGQKVKIVIKDGVWVV